MLLMFEQGIRGIICHSINRYNATLILNIWKIKIGIKNQHILNIET